MKIVKEQAFYCVGDSEFSPVINRFLNENEILADSIINIFKEKMDILGHTNRYIVFYKEEQTNGKGD